MIAALFVAGPAVLLAIMAWAIDRFTSVPPSSPKIDKARARSIETAAIRQSVALSKNSNLEMDSIHRLFNEAEDAQEFLPLKQALQRFDAKRSRSMAEDHYPDPKRSRYQEIDSLELQSQRVVFQKNGRLRLEARSGVVEPGHMATVPEDSREAARFNR